MGISREARNHAVSSRKQFDGFIQFSMATMHLINEIVYALFLRLVLPTGHTQLQIYGLPNQRAGR